MTDSADRPVVLVTGGSRGIGRAICQNLAPDWHVLVGGRSADSVAPVVDSLPSAEPFVADLLDADSTASAASRLVRLDALVHSAGRDAVGPVGQASRDAWRAVFELNVIAIADLTRLLLPLLRESHGDVVTINSGAGWRVGAGGGLYGASKFALRAFTDALREEERGVVRVTSIHPGRVDTDMQRALQAHEGHEYRAGDYLRPASVAAAVRLALEATPEAMIESLSIRPVVRS